MRQHGNERNEMCTRRPRNRAKFVGIDPELPCVVSDEANSPLNIIDGVRVNNTAESSSIGIGGSSLGRSARSGRGT